MGIENVIKKEQEQKLEILEQIGKHGLTDEMRQSENFQKLFPDWGEMERIASNAKENERY